MENTQIEDDLNSKISKGLFDRSKRFGMTGKRKGYFFKVPYLVKETFEGLKNISKERKLTYQ